MNLDVINILFKMTLFGGILYQMRSFFMQYGYQALKEAHDTDVDLKKKKNDSIIQLRHNISSENENLINIIQMLKILKKKIEYWHNDIEERFVIEEKNRADLHQKHIINISEQMQSHVVQKKQMSLIVESSIDAIEQIKQNNPELFKEYTRKQIQRLNQQGEKK